MEDVQLEERICGAMIRYGRRDLLVDVEGKIIEEEEVEKSEGELLEENRHREIFDSDTHVLDFRKMMPTKV